MLDGLLENARRALDTGMVDVAETLTRQAKDLAPWDERVDELERALHAMKNQRRAMEATIGGHATPPAPSAPSARFEDTLTGKPLPRAPLDETLTARPMPGPALDATLAAPKPAVHWNAAPSVDDGWSTGDAPAPVSVVTPPPPAPVSRPLRPAVLLGSPVPFAASAPPIQAIPVEKVVDSPARALFEQARESCGKRVMWAAVEQCVQGVIAGADRQLLLGSAGWMDAEFADACRKRLGRMDACPVVARGPAELSRMKFSPEAAFVLTRCDGMATVEDLADTCGLPGVVTLILVATLLTMGAIRL